jgi:predicted metal-dependent phosphotriesterase family hydrolase
MGITRIVVTHPLKDPIHMSIDDMREAAKLGAFLEFDASGVLPTTENHLAIADYVKAIHAVGADHCILSSDLGQAVNAVHTEGWKKYLTDLTAAGLKPNEITVMTRRNPARFLGLE